MELWDLFDENRRFLYKQHNRQEPLAPGHYHVVVVVCVVNSKEEILVTRRRKLTQIAGKIQEEAYLQGRQAVREQSGSLRKKPESVYQKKN